MCSNRCRCDQHRNRHAGGTGGEELVVGCLAVLVAPFALVGFLIWKFFEAIGPTGSVALGIIVAVIAGAVGIYRLCEWAAGRRK